MSPTTPRVVSRNPDSKKRRILEAARRLLIEHEFQEIVLDDVAKRAGVAKGTLFLHYKSKEDLFSAALLDLADGLGLELEALIKAEVSGKDLLVAAAKVILTVFDHSRDFLGHIGAGRVPNCGASSREKLLEKYRSNQALVRRILELAAGTQALRDPEFAAVAFIGLCRSAAVRKIVYDRDRPLEREAEHIVTFFMEGCGLSL
jgi:AcrR family transcriptional regulator